MSRLIKIFQKLNFLDNSIQDSDIPQTIPAFISSQDIPKDITFITSRILLIPFPEDSNMSSIAGYLNTMYSKKYMVWNLSEHLYNSDIFNTQVLDFVFVGYPNPPLHEIFAIFNSISGWLDSDSDNVAVVHCQQTRARSYMIISAYLAWQNTKNPIKFFQDIGGDRSTRLFPSHYRYFDYIHQVVKGQRPRGKKLHLKKIIINGKPIDRDEFLPYIQLYKDSKMIYSSLKDGKSLGFSQNDQVASFDVDLEVEGDVLLRCRENVNGTTITIFRTMFNTAFSDDYSLRFFKKELDSAQESFLDDFMIDLFYTSLNLETFVVPSNLKIHTVEEQKVNGGKIESKEDEEESIDRDLLEKYKAQIEISESSESEDDLDDYFKKLESGK